MNGAKSGRRLLEEAEDAGRGLSGYLSTPAFISCRFSVCRTEITPGMCVALVASKTESGKECSYGGTRQGL